MHLCSRSVAIVFPVAVGSLSYEFNELILSGLLYTVVVILFAVALPLPRHDLTGGIRLVLPRRLDHSQSVSNWRKLCEIAPPTPSTPEIGFL